MTNVHSRFMTTNMLINAAVQAERHAFDKQVSTTLLKKNVASSKLHLATVIVPNNQSGRILVPHHRVEILMHQTHLALNKKFALDISIDAWEMLIPVAQLQLVLKELQMYPYLHQSNVGTVE